MIELCSLLLNESHTGDIIEASLLRAKRLVNSMPDSLYTTQFLMYCYKETESIFRARFSWPPNLSG